jgi:hypothetical protein
VLPYGTVIERIEAGAEYKDSKGRKPVAYPVVLAKLKITVEDAKAYALSEGIELPESVFEMPVEAEKPKKVAASGRPKKAGKSVVVDESEDLFAGLVQNSLSESAPVDESEEKALAAQAKAAEKALAAQEKAAKLEAEKAEKAEKAAKLEADKQAKAEKLVKFPANQLENLNKWLSYYKEHKKFPHNRIICSHCKEAFVSLKGIGMSWAMKAFDNDVNRILTESLCKVCKDVLNPKEEKEKAPKGLLNFIRVFF